jgi:hypothetical protein
MNIVEMFSVNNDCYKANAAKSAASYTTFQQRGPLGLMLHSVGCSQPSAEVFAKLWNKADYQVAVHAVLEPGKVIQCLPWNYRGWHGASGAKGSVNNTHVGVEMTEPAHIKYTSGANYTDSDPAKTKAFALETYKTAVELFAMLCVKYGLDPLGDGVIISHSEGNARGIASAHADVEHIWAKVGLTMNQFRLDVKAAMGATATKPATTATPTPNATSGDEAIWNFLIGKGLNAYAAAGLVGNLYAESGLKSNNLQNSYEKSLGYTDETYTAAVDSGKYTNFVKDSAGYGLAQWTYYTRKQALLDFAKAAGASIGDLATQLNFLWKELQGYTAVINVLKSAKSVAEGSNVVLLQFERPADQSAAAQSKRAAYGQTYYDKYAGTSTSAPAPTPASSALPYTVKVTAAELNIRAGAGTGFAVKGSIKDKGVYTIVEEASGAGATKWGKLKSGAGWISLDYVKKV